MSINVVNGKETKRETSGAQWHVSISKASDDVECFRRLVLTKYNIAIRM